MAIKIDGVDVVLANQACSVCNGANHVNKAVINLSLKPVLTSRGIEKATRCVCAMWLTAECNSSDPDWPTHLSFSETSPSFHLWHTSYMVGY
jgi:hypothetical protein